MSPLSVQQLLDHIQSQDEEALVELHARYIDPVYSVAYQVLRNQQDAEEVAQDVFMRIWHKADTYDQTKGVFTSWLLTITRRLAIDHLRKRQRRTPQQPMIFVDEHPHLWETKIIDDNMTDLQRNLISVLQELPDEQRQALQLAYFHGLSHSEIANHLNKPLGTIKSQIRMGMKKLRNAWFASESQSLSDEDAS